jgi:spoIIIJ-associated protein
MEHHDIKKFIEELLARMGVAFDRIDIAESGGHPVFSIATADSKVLIGHQGETLRALNLIMRRAFENTISAEELKFRIDVNGYYADRDGQLVREARLLAERARLFKYDVDMRPLNPYERMVVHEALRGFGDITTESKGEGALRHIVVCYRPGGAAPTTADSSSPPPPPES